MSNCIESERTRRNAMKGPRAEMIMSRYRNRWAGS